MISAPPWGVGRLGVLDHQAFVASGLRGIEKLVEFLRRRGLEYRGADHLSGWRADVIAEFKTCSF